MFNEPFIQFLLLAFIVGLALSALLLRGQKKDNPLATRLRHLRDDHQADAPAAVITSDYAALPAWLAQAGAIGEQLAGTEEDRNKLQRLLNTAGWRHPQGLGLLLLAKYGCGLVLLCVALWGVLDASSRFGLPGLALGLIALFVGTTAPEFYLKMRAGQRHEALSRSMPDALDLMVICAEVGLPFPRILKLVSRELALSAPAMADELAYTSAELQLLSDRSQALLNLARRTSVASIESMVASLIQAERYGTPLSQALRTIADETRSTLILSLEEKAGKLPAQLSVPLMTLILPPVVAIVATPALVRVIRSLM